MGDYISREEVIKAIDAREKVDGNVCAEDIRLDICLLPSVQPVENKGEYIKREDAIDEFKAQKDAWEYYGESFYNVRYIAFDNAIETIRNLPTYSFPDREKGEWIPVSERLPKNDKDVLVYDDSDIFVAWYSKKIRGWGSLDERFDEYTPIIAWQPLPEPYKAEKGGE